VIDPGEAARRIRRRLRPQRTGPFARYSRFVGIMKIVLPSLTLVLLALLVAWPRLTVEESGFQIGFARLPSKEVETLAMQNPRYFGINETNRPFAVSADLATQENGRSDIVHLNNPKADFTTSSGANVVIEADSGLYQKASNTLLLTGNVNLYHDSGTELHTNSATIDLAHSAAHGTDPVTGNGPQGRVDAAGFDITNKGRTLTFTGKSTMSLRSAGASASKTSKTGKTQPQGAPHR
jgi:lipopolysaccharide export system protein LptC